ncbi:MAG: LytR family transcriptional regulator [Firmicutes bacterium]|nr:LytR family transcriptional regulator [Bacillota bacterium]
MKKIKVLFILLFTFLIILYPYTHKKDNNIKEFNNNYLDNDNLHNLISKVKTLNIKNKEKEKIENKEIKNTKNDKPLILALYGTDERNTEKSRSDVLMIIKYTPKKDLYILSIPRDSKVKIPGKWITKINAAHAYGGIKLQNETIKNLLDINIDYYLHVNFNGFIKIIDSLGGVKVNAKKDFYYNDEKLIVKKGIHTLNGEKALKYVRFRHDSEGDFGRIKRQQEVILSIGKQILNPKNIFKVPSAINIVKGNVKSNIDWKLLLNTAFKIKNIDSLNIKTHTLKTYSKKENGIWYEIIKHDDLLRVKQVLK